VVRTLGPLAAGTAPDPAATFSEVCVLLEQVMDATAGAPTRAAAPAPAPAKPSVAVHGEMAEDPSLDMLPHDLDVDLLKDFLVESRDCITGSEAALLALEHTPDDIEAVNTVFRAFHTVKGTSAFIGLARLSAFGHEAESLLSRVRDREISYSARCADLALRSVDMLKALLDAVDDGLRAGGAGCALRLPDGYRELVASLAGHDETDQSEKAAAKGATLAPVTSPVPGATPVVAIAPAAAEAAPVAAAPNADRRQGDRRQTDRRAGGSEAETSLRVRTDRLDRLIDMVGELVIAQTMIAGDQALASAAGQHHELTKKISHAGKIVRELQDLSMSMRMVPLKTTFQKLTRLVRDVTSKLGKDVEFILEGEDTEIDRTLVDVVGDPLVHMVRNALDHGVESPDDREKAGKPRQGRVKLTAYQAGGSVVVELQDDGRGLDREKILKKALEKGLIESDRGMTDSDVFQLIFAPGFSTADQITDVSGRGVGMDVVKRNIESVRGRVEISSVLGQGTTFYVRLPLTLAVTDGMLVRVGNERYVVPLTNIHMSFRPEPSMLQSIAGRGEVVMLRGDVMPVVRLHTLFNVENAVEDATNAILMIVGDGRQRRSALVVDELLGQQQVVAKSLGDGIGTVPGVAGGAILGDGRVGLILDVAEICALAQSGEALDEAPVEEQTRTKRSRRSA
jgi:two-component system chemotaxis sensor kinase CheA